jgi:hypothetical protein
VIIEPAGGIVYDPDTYWDSQQVTPTGMLTT